jgi:hypothetical protein
MGRHGKCVVKLFFVDFLFVSLTFGISRFDFLSGSAKFGSYGPCVWAFFDLRRLNNEMTHSFISTGNLVEATGRMTKIDTLRKRVHKRCRFSLEWF